MPNFDSKVKFSILKSNSRFSIVLFLLFNSSSFQVLALNIPSLVNKLPIFKRKKNQISVFCSKFV